MRFNPKATLDILEQGEPPAELTDEDKEDLVTKYLEVSRIDKTRTSSPLLLILDFDGSPSVIILKFAELNFPRYRAIQSNKFYF